MRGKSSSVVNGPTLFPGLVPAAHRVSVGCRCILLGAPSATTISSLSSPMPIRTFSTTSTLRQQHDDVYDDEEGFDDYAPTPRSRTVVDPQQLTPANTNVRGPVQGKSITDALIDEDVALSEEVENEEAANSNEHKESKPRHPHYAKAFKQGRREFNPEQITTQITAEKHSSLSSMMSTGGQPHDVSGEHHSEKGFEDGSPAPTSTGYESQLVKDAMLLSLVGNRSMSDRVMSSLEGSEKGSDAYVALQTLKRHRAAFTAPDHLLPVSEILNLIDAAKGPGDIRSIFEKHILTNPLFNDVFNGHGTRVAIIGRLTGVVAKTFSVDVFLEVLGLAVQNGFNLTRLHVNELLTAIRVDLTAMFQQYGRDPKVVMITLRRLQITLALSKQDGVVFEGVFLSRLLLMCTIMVTYFDRQNYYRNSFPADFMRREGLVSDWVISHVRATDYDECVRVLSKFVKETIINDHHLHQMCIRPGFTTLYRLLDFFFSTDNLSQMIATMEEAQEHLDMNLAEASIAKMMQMSCSFNYPLTIELFRKYRLFNKESVVAAPDMSRLMTYYGRSGGGMPCPHCKEPYNHRNVQLEVWESTPTHQRACPLLRMQREQRGELEELCALQPESSALDAFKAAQAEVFKIVQGRVAAEEEAKRKADESFFLTTGSSKANSSPTTMSDAKQLDTGDSATATNANALVTTTETPARVDADLVSLFPAQTSYPPLEMRPGSPDVDAPQCRDWSGVALSLFEYSQIKGLEWGMAEWRGFLQCCTFLREPEEVMALLKRDIVTAENFRKEHADRTVGHTDLNPNQAWRLLPEDVPLFPPQALKSASPVGAAGESSPSSPAGSVTQPSPSVEDDSAIASLMRSSYSLSMQNVKRLFSDPHLSNLQRKDAFFLVPNTLEDSDSHDADTNVLISRAAAEFHAGSSNLHNVLRLYRLESAKDVVSLELSMKRKPLDDGSSAFDAPRMTASHLAVVSHQSRLSESGAEYIDQSVSDVLDGAAAKGGNRNGASSSATSILPSLRPPAEQFTRRDHSSQRHGRGGHNNNNKPQSPFDGDKGTGSNNGDALSIGDQYDIYKPLLVPPPDCPTPAKARRWITLSRREKFHHILYNVIQPNINRQKHFEDIIARLYLRFLRINDPSLVYPTVQDWFMNGVGLGRSRRGGEISPVLSEEIVLAAFSISNDQPKLRAEFTEFAAARVRSQDLFLMAMAKRRARAALWANGILVKLPKRHPRVVKAMASNSLNVVDPLERRIRRSEERRNTLSSSDEKLVDVVFPAVEQSRFADSDNPSEAGFVYMINPAAIGVRLSGYGDDDSVHNIASPEVAAYNTRMLREYVFLARKVPRNIHAKVEFKDSGSDIVPNSGKKNWYSTDSYE